MPPGARPSVRARLSPFRLLSGPPPQCALQPLGKQRVAGTTHLRDCDAVGVLSFYFNSREAFFALTDTERMGSAARDIGDVASGAVMHRAPFGGDLGRGRERCDRQARDRL